MDIKKQYKSRIGDDRYNTSYPLRPIDWVNYRFNGELSFDHITDLCFYAHIPFCKKLCQFCEYTRMLCPSEELQKHYVLTLAKDVDRFLGSCADITLHGFDIGGGTPTALCNEAFERLTEMFGDVREKVPVSSDFEPSIEGTFATMSDRKAKLINSCGIHRVSLGVQSANAGVLSINNREKTEVGEMSDIVQMLHVNGIRKVNLDFMYGLRGQTLKSLEHDIAVINHLFPEQVTLYELRTNMINQSSPMTSMERYIMYSFLYEALTGMGYHGHFGQNTFSKDNEDFGLSSYLRHRMIKGMAYKGFGLSAQSMTDVGLSYNLGKNCHSLASAIRVGSYPSEYTYILPPQEIAAKYIAIAAYSGSFSWKRYKQLLGTAYGIQHEKTLQFCIDEGLMSREKDTIRITSNGFLHYGATFSLFFSINNHL